jgi:hypothetical protein
MFAQERLRSLQHQRLVSLDVDLQHFHVPDPPTVHVGGKL